VTRDKCTSSAVDGVEMDDKPRGSSPSFLVESPVERLSPSHQRVYRDDLSPVTDHPPPCKRKIAINIGASPSGFILEEDEEEQEEQEEEEFEEELEVVDARMFRPIVEPQSSGDQPDEVQEEPADDFGDDLGGQPLDVVVGQPTVSDGPGEVSDNEDDGTPEDHGQVDVGEVPEADPVCDASAASQPEDAWEFQHEAAAAEVVEEQLIDFGDNAEDREGQHLTSTLEPHCDLGADDDVDLPPPPPPPEQEQDGDHL